MTASSLLMAKLPPAVAERAEARRHAEARGEFVLYWTAQALRGHENPAFDAALLAAAELQLPLLVYQGLSEKHPYASDRLHDFMLAGGRDAGPEIARRGAAFFCHVERPGCRGPWLRELGRRAALIVAEECPVAPLPAWRQGLLAATAAPLWTVDTACVVPMRLVGQAYDRAFAFRDATERLREERLAKPWHDAEARLPAWGGTLPFAPVDLSKPWADIVAAAEIDHAAGPVPEFPGGMIAGYERWNAFRANGLRAYARQRNDAAAPDGVSRLSAYLHFGMVSPLRIAREAAAVPGPGPEKYLDELLVWRELAHAFCFHRGDHDALTALPRWARETLGAHERDDRPALPSLTTLAAGRSGDSLWDACQRSLRRHGELHNNLRMTWGKALLDWTPDAAAAWAALRELNHRYALDGRDPSSYGGLLWCLGQFDRPFAPERPILGTVRPRPTREHARRIDLAEYQRHVARPAFGAPRRVGIVGSGIAGLACARTLAEHGIEVATLDKGRMPGGRASARRRPEYGAFEHGTVAIQATDRRFRRVVDSWRHDGLLAEWTPRTVGLETGLPLHRQRRWAATPGWDALAARYAEGLDVRQGVEIARVRRDPEGWRLFDQEGREFGPFDALATALPAPQTAKLAAEIPALAAAANAAVYAPCWTAMIAFAEPLPVPWDWGRGAVGTFAEVVRETSKPGRPAVPEGWTLQATPAWTTRHLERSPEEVLPLLLAEFRRLVGPTPEPRHASAHRWRYARPTVAWPARFAFDPAAGAGACGDWCGGDGVQAAYLSGVALAGRLMGAFAAEYGTRFELA